MPKPGTFQPGTSGNPGGKPKGLAELRRLALERSPRALERLAELVESDDARIACDAAKAILDRAGLVPPKAAGDLGEKPDDTRSTVHATVTELLRVVKDAG